MRGTLTITIDPPFVRFRPQTRASLEAGRYCKKEEILQILAQLGAESLPLKNAVVKIEGDFATEMLLGWHLLPARFS
jgi:hypothetical protein